MSGEGFGAVPTAVVRDKTLSGDAKLVLLALSTYAGLPQIKPSHATLAEITGLSDRTVRRRLAELRERQLVEWKTITTAKGLTNVYRLVTPWTGTEIDRLPAVAAQAGEDLFGSEGGAVTVTAPPGGSGQGGRRGAVTVAGEVDRKEVDKPHVLDEPFARFWQVYPRTRLNVSKKEAVKSFRKAVQDGADPEAIVLAATRFAAYCTQQRIEERHIAMPTTWLNQARYESFLGADAEAAVAPAAAATGGASWLARM